ncbi:MAG TPA: proline dehydrogenase family protein [Candidatus Acidoferrales bacterium]|nr:proline dehydrogenase family protein [Candidatus Acidoferrales bacterium]
MRRAILRAAQSHALRRRAPQYAFVRRSTARFMPGETAETALAAAVQLAQFSVGAALSHLGENITDRTEAEAVVQHYLGVAERIRAMGSACGLSVKLTQLGLDLSAELCLANLKRVAAALPASQALWIDMEQAAYGDATLDLYRQARREFPNVGVCLQAYLYRTETDIESLIASGAMIRLVKGAYNEPPEIAFPRKADVDESYLRIARMFLDPQAVRAGARATFGTHDRTLIRRICEWAATRGISKDAFEFQMLYGIQRAEQLRLAREGYRSSVLICYGSYWFPWFMRRLAERPANVLFLARHLVAG